MDNASFEHNDLQTRPDLFLFFPSHEDHTNEVQSASESSGFEQLSNCGPTGNLPGKSTSNKSKSICDERTEKRRRNNLAAAKYRQKKIDRIKELENQLQSALEERDELKIKLAKRDAEVEVLRRMLEGQSSTCS
ncbi:uncharacterized protein PV09_07470 [Verruconis gallopava]|uniref:BZIP domain-containing protein n=1 Tax=Verruconis gallopava TaxID=253628 RepID=A0A0D2APU4_9PEZI|nr:uncharacterized protein PV09_07470 [Verruconis gallopava]KIW01189.1 hypothetical protein PV09_07470 [Verruconis gallopava]